MKSYTLAVLFLLLAGVVLWGQHSKPAPSGDYSPLEVKTLLPHEVSPGVYSQVEGWELQQAGQAGWELVSVTPYVYRNEERGKDTPKAIVTQTYPAYFFQRVRK